MRKIAALLLVLAFPSIPARAFVCLHADQNDPGSPCLHWTQDQATLSSFLPNSDWNQSAVNAGNEWNGVGANFQFHVNIGGQLNEPCGASGAAHACRNTGPRNDNPIVFRGDLCGQAFGSDIIELTLNCWDPNSGAMINAPVFVNSGVPWDAYDGPIHCCTVFNGVLQPVNDIRRVLLHELGHVLGLDHPDMPSTRGIAPQSVVAIMNSQESDLDRLQSDDIGGILSIYPNTTSPSASGPPPTTGCRIAAADGSGMWLLAFPALLALSRRWRSSVGSHG